MELKRLNVWACGDAPRCGDEIEDDGGEYIRTADLLNALKNPEIVWMGGKRKRVASVNGIKIGFVEKMEHFAFEPMCRWYSPFSERNTPLFVEIKDAEFAVEESFRTWLAGVIKVV